MFAITSGAQAEESEAASKIEVDESALLDEQYEASGANELYETLPDETKALLEENEISGPGDTDFSDFSIGGFFKTLWSTLTGSLKKPFAIFACMTGLMLLAALLEAVRSAHEDDFQSKAFSVASVTACCSILILPVVECIRMAASTIQNASVFLMGFIPVFSSAVAVSGKPTSAIGYSAALFSVVEIISAIASGILVPLMCIYLAFCTIGSVGDTVQISGIAEGVKKSVNWIMGICMTIFIGLFTMQGLVTGATDTLGSKTAKFLLSGVPVVGGAVSEAFNSIQGCLGVMRSSIGAFGVIVCILTFIPTVVTLALMIFSLRIAGYIGEMLHVPKLPDIMKAAGDTLSILLGITLCFSLLLIVTITIMLTLGA